MKQFLILICSLGMALAAMGQQNKQANNNTKSKDEDKAAAFNLKDEKGRKTGMWILKQEALRGEPATTSFGNYLEGRKMGTWYNIDNEGRPISILKYFKGELNGESKYFENGQLFCIGQWRGLNPDVDFDTVEVYNPVTDITEYVAVPTERGSLQHGIWKYYHPDSGVLIKEEEYQVGERIRLKEYHPQATLSEEVKQQLDKKQQQHLQKPPYKPTKIKPNKL